MNIAKLLLHTPEECSCIAIEVYSVLKSIGTEKLCLWVSILIPESSQLHMRVLQLLPGTLLVAENGGCRAGWRET